MVKPLGILQHLDKMEFFAAVAESGSLHAAARRLQVSQPALSQTVKTLEKAAGCQLIVRSREGVTLTAAGKKLYDFALQVLADAKRLEEHLGGNSTIGRNIRVGIFESIAIYAWPKVQQQMKRQAKDFGGVEFDLFTGRTDDLLKRLGISEIDIAVAVDPSVGELQVRELLFKDHFYLYGMHDDPALSILEERKKSEVTVARPLFLFESARVSADKSLRSHLAGASVSFETINRVDSFEVASEFVRAGLGFAFLPEKVAAKHANRLHKVRLKGRDQEPLASHAIYACASRSVASGKPFHLLCNALKTL